MLKSRHITSIYLFFNIHYSRRVLNSKKEKKKNSKLQRKNKKGEFFCMFIKGRKMNKGERDVT